MMLSDRVQELAEQLGAIQERVDAQAASLADTGSEVETVKPTVALQFATLLDSRIDSLRGEVRAETRESTQSLKEDARERMDSLKEEFRETAKSLKEEFRETAKSSKEDARDTTRSIRKEMRFLVAGVGGFVLTGFLFLTARVTDLSVALARVETELALLVERIPIQ